MKKVFPLLLALILCCISCQSTAAPATATPGLPEATFTPISPTNTASPSLEYMVLEMQSYLEGLEETGEYSGAVLIAYQGVPIFQSAYGQSDRENDLPNLTDTKFNLGSLDKMFTAVAIMQLVAEGEISLEGLVGDYLPDYPVAEVAESVTIHQLLTHTSGLGSYFDSPIYNDQYDQIRSLDDYFNLFSVEGLLFPPGSQFGYSNSGYIVLGLIIEAVSGQSYFDYVQEHIFEPAGMVNTACYELDSGTPNLAIGYTTLDSEGNDTGQITDNFFLLPMRGGSAGGGYSTAPDLLAFGNALLGHQLLNMSSTELLLEGKIDLREDVRYAYGFFDMLDEGHRRVGHGGGFPGICSVFNMYPDLELTIVILSNSDGDCLAVMEFFSVVFLREMQN